MARGIAIVGDVAAGQFYVPRAQHLMDRLETRQKLNNSQVLRDFERLDDGAYCYAMLAGGTIRAVIVVDPVELPVLEGDDQRDVFIPDVPDFYSGVVVRGNLTEDLQGHKKLDFFTPTAACAELFKLQGGVATISSYKLAVEPFTSFAKILASPATVNFSQYVKLKPTMYSGTMRKVVQLLMGFGHQLGKKSRYDLEPPRPVEVGQKPKPTKYQRDVKNNGRQIRYDWRWYRTHGIYRAVDGVLWLIEVSQLNGILAMRLPMNKISQTPEFRDKLDLLQDSAGLIALDELGGFPTGEAFPATSMESWIRAGKVIRMASAANMTPFYSKGAYSSALGWAFNSSGSEAHNTCFEFGPDGIQVGYHYCAAVSIGISAPERDPQPGAVGIKKLIGPLADKPLYRTRFDAVVYKVDHMETSQMAEVQEEGQTKEQLFEALDAFVLEPSAAATGSLSVVGSGKLYFVGLVQPHIKFPEPELGYYLLTHDMNPAGDARYEGRCDTTMHVFFADDVLKWVKFFHDPKTAPARTGNNFEECMYVGKWSSTAESELQGITPQMYTTDFDDREAFPGTSTVTEITSVDMGYTSVIYGDNPLYPPQSFVHRTRQFRQTSITTQKTGEFIATAVTVPFHDRCAYYYTRAHGTDSSYVLTNSAYNALNDPYRCVGWQNVIGYTGFATTACTNRPPPWACWTRAQHPSECGPVEHRTVVDPGAQYDPYPCSEYADRGPWCFTCDNIEALAYSITLPALPSIAPVEKIRVVFRSTRLVNESTHSPVLVEPEFETDMILYKTPWFKPSPDPETGAVQYMECTHNAFGEADLLRYWSSPFGEVVLLGGPIVSGMKTEATTFVGVV